MKTIFTFINQPGEVVKPLAIKPTAEELIALYEAGNPSVKDATTAYYDGRVPRGSYLDSGRGKAGALTDANPSSQT